MGTKAPARVVRNRFSWEIEFRSRTGAFDPCRCLGGFPMTILNFYDFGAEPTIFVANYPTSALLVEL
jgi:hypothetical protein